MLIRYLVFCFGCGMPQTAWERTPFPWQPGATLDVPLPFLKPAMFLSVQVLMILSTLAEIAVGVYSFKWWGLVIWLPGMFVASLIFPGKNPAPCFFVGALVAAVGILLLVTA